MANQFLADYAIDGYNRQDKFGYYTVGAFKTYSKLEAIELANKTSGQLVWHFNDAVFQSLDWTKEPVESIQEIYRRRAQQLRDTYDYLVLWYSGGADCENILNTFLDNDIKLDEIVSYTNLEGTDDKKSQINAEIFYVAMPAVEKAKLQQPDIKYRVIDMSQHMVNHFSTIGLDWIYGHNGMFTPLHETKSTLKLRITEWKDLFEQGKKVGFISGVEKPIIMMRPDNKFYFRFNDFVIDNTVTPQMQMDNHAWDFNEFFYWTPDCPEMLLKQSHIIKNALKVKQHQSLEDQDRAWPDGPPAGGFPGISTGSMAQLYTNDTEYVWIDTNDITTMVYPKWRPIPYQSKAKSTIVFDKDMWFFNQGLNEQSLKNWIKGMNKVLAVTKRNKRDHFGATAVLHSPAYCLGN